MSVPGEVQTWTALCSCGRLRIDLEGPPLSVSVCHCHACQRRTGSAFGIAAFWNRNAARPTGESTTWTRTGDSGRAIRFHFCPVCATTLWWEPEFKPDAIAVAAGALTPSLTVAPARQFWTDCRMPWLSDLDDLPEHPQQ